MTDLNNTQAAPVVAKKAPLFKKTATFETPDGKVFNTQKEAAEHVRGHLVVDAVNAVAAKFDGSVIVKNPETGDEEIVSQTLGEFLLANKADVLKAYDAAKIERAPVTEETKEKMRLARAAGKSLVKEAAEKAKQKAADKAAAEARGEVYVDPDAGQAQPAANETDGALA